MYLPLDEHILPVVMEELSKAALTVHTKVDHNGIGIMVGEVTTLLKHFDHCLPIRGPGLIKLAHSHILRVLWDGAGYSIQYQDM